MDKLHRLNFHRCIFTLLIICLIASCKTLPTTDTSYSTKPGDAEIAGKYAIYAMMASDSYHSENKIFFPLKAAGWQQVDLNGKPSTEATASHCFTGLAYDIFEEIDPRDRSKNTNRVIFAFRGTDSKWDYFVSNFTPFISPAYKQAVKSVREYIDAHPDKKVLIVTGHSLGGGLALSVSVKLGIDAVVFDSSPRLFDGLGDNHKPANRVLIFQKGEILEKLRSVWRKIFEVIPKESIHSYSFNFSGESDHRGDCLAYELLKLGATSDQKLTPILAETDKANKSNAFKCMQ